MHAPDLIDEFLQTHGKNRVAELSLDERSDLLAQVAKEHGLSAEELTEWITAINSMPKASVVGQEAIDRETPEEQLAAADKILVRVLDEMFPNERRKGEKTPN